MRFNKRYSKSYDVEVARPFYLLLTTKVTNRSELHSQDLKP